MFEHALFIFRRDLRLEDNTGLIRALQNSRHVSCAFIFDPRQCEPHDYFSANAAEFLRESVRELALELAERGGRLNLFYGPVETVLEELLPLEKIDAVFINKDYTPYSRRRDSAIRRLVQRHGSAFEEWDDVLLCPPGTVMRDAGGPYTVFTPYFRKASGIEVLRPRGAGPGQYRSAALKSSYLCPEGKPNGISNPELAVHGGRSAALAILKRLRGSRDYEKDRDYPSLAATTGLSAHLKFGTLSAREAHAAVASQLGSGHPLIRQLHWRDFFTMIGYYYPHVYGHPFCDEYQHMPWENDQGMFQAWCEGRTGFPFVDAGMRQLVRTGFMHNRTRMVAASVLVKDLHIDWLWGERFFARHLVDYDPAVNNGNWQWAASTGCDHQPYFRIFNPWLQQQKFDPAGDYIRRWVAELSDVPADVLHRPGAAAESSRGAYPFPLIDHAVAAAWSKQAFKEASRRDIHY